MSEHAIQFSGGKDSLAVLYLMREHADKVTVYFGDTGGVYPHSSRFVHDACEGLGFSLKVVAPPMALDAFHAEYGYPADIVPVDASLPMIRFSRHGGAKLQSLANCCGAMLWNPMQQALIEDGVKHVYRGSKLSDGHVGVPDNYTDENGITYHSPLWNWTDADVFAYLKSVGAELADHYRVANNSFDCIMCTAFLKSSGARERLEYTRDNYPEHWPELKRRIGLVRDAIDSNRSALNDAFSMCEAQP